MPTDVCAPGPNGDYPSLPKNPDGTIDTTRILIGIGLSAHVDQFGQRLRLRHMPRTPDGRPITDLFPLPEGQTPDDLLPRTPQHPAYGHAFWKPGPTPEMVV